MSEESSKAKDDREPVGGDSFRSPRALSTITRVVLASVAAVLISAASTTIDFWLNNDPIPAPGISFRGMPLPFLAIWPMLKGNILSDLDRLPRDAQVYPWGLTIDLVFWFAAAYGVLGIPNGVVAARFLRRRRDGMCGHCGYDLRASCAARCPECGNRVLEE